MAKSRPSTAVAEGDPPAPPRSPEIPREINWSAVKRRYQNDRRKTIAEIASHYGIDKDTLRERGRMNGWRRPDSRRKQDREAQRPPGTMRDRIMALFEGRLTQMEIELQHDHLPPRTTVQGHTTELNRMIRALGTAKAAPVPAGAATPAGASDDDQDAWRRELVERIRALKQRLSP